MSAIIVTIDGGLGNQLFQYAAGYALAKKQNVPLLLDLSYFDITQSSATVIRKLQLDNFNTPYQRYHAPAGQKTYQPSIIGRIKNRIIHRVFPVKDSSQIYTQPGYHFDESFFDLKAPRHIRGSFQSEYFFKDVEDDIRSMLTLKNPISDTAKPYLQEIQSKKTPVSLHVRRGDYVQSAHTNSYHGTASQDYYTRSIKLMQNLYGNDVHFFIFSDDPQYVTEAYRDITNKTIVIGDTDYPHEDIFLMAQCHHHIIANSSFSWWGAWLNPRKDKTVLAPRHWFARKAMKENNTMDLYPQGWMTL